MPQVSTAEQLGMEMKNSLHVVYDRLRNVPYYFSVMHYVFDSCPSIFFPLYRWREGDSGNIVQRDTQLVIEGYPRSGNTFAETALKLCQPQPIKTADHLHAPAQVIRAAQYHIPLCVLIRRPEDVVRSLVVKYPRIRVADALKGYVRFYETCLPYQHAFLVATFTQVTTDFGRVIDGINEKFGTRFIRFEHTEANVRRVFELLEQRNVRLNQGKTLMSYHPNPQKETMKSQVLLAPHHALLQRCRDLFSAYVKLAEQWGSIGIALLLLYCNG
jgi:hypothetical protein